LNTLLIAPELFSSEGGITRMLRLYLKALCEIASEGDSVSFISLNDASVDSSDLRPYSGNRLTAWQACSGNKAAFCLRALRMGLHADRIICGHVAQLPVAWAASMLRPGLAYYLVAHGIEVWRPFTFLERRALRGAACIWCVSEFTRQRLLERCPLPDGRTRVLPNALDPFLAPSSPISPPGPAPVILTITRLSAADSYKGVDHLIDAMPAVLADVPEARLRIVGRGDGLRGLGERARALGVDRSVEFAGYVGDADLPSEFAGCRLFALPSEREGFGLVYLEAMAHGRPCLAASAGGAPEVLTQDTGLLVEYGDATGLAAAIVVGLRREWSIEALITRAQEFSYLRFKERLSSLLLA
jgi:glycosyltransferase involved in cell wall biosynthesis